MSSVYLNRMVLDKFAHFALPLLFCYLSQTLKETEMTGSSKMAG